MRYFQVLCALALLPFLSSCVPVTYSRSIEVTRGPSFDERFKLAKSMATKDNVAVFKKELSERLPELTSWQLALVHVGWKSRRTVVLGSGSTTNAAYVVVSMWSPLPLPNLIRDQQNAMKIAVEILEPQVTDH